MSELIDTDDKALVVPSNVTLSLPAVTALTLVPVFPDASVKSMVNATVPSGVAGVVVYVASQFISSPDAFVRVVGVCAVIVTTGDAIGSENVNDKVIISPGFAKVPAGFDAVEFVLLDAIETGLTVGDVLSYAIFGVGACDTPAFPAKSVYDNVDAIMEISSSAPLIV